MALEASLDRLGVGRIYSRFDPKGSSLADRPRRKSVHGASQRGSAEEVLCVKSWSKDGGHHFE